MMVIQTGGKSVEEVKDRVLEIVKRYITFIGYEVQKEIAPIEKVFNTVPQVMKDYKVTHVVIYA